VEVHSSIISKCVKTDPNNRDTNGMDGGMESMLK